MRIALIGAYGQLGTDLQTSLPFDVVSLGHHQLELSNVANIKAQLDTVQPDAVINAAAYNLVDRAEDEPDVALAINACGVRNLAQYCGARNIVLMHFSTDYVFGGDAARTTPYSETDAPEPLSAYAVSKLAGEHFVRAFCERHFVVRTCGLYGVAARRGAGKGNFIETMLRFGRERSELRVVNDQLCTPTSTADLAAAAAELLTTNLYGLYHATNAGQMSWFELASEVLRLRGLKTQVLPITSAEFRAKARRPSYSVLATRKLSTAIGHELPAWQDAVARYLSTENA